MPYAVSVAVVVPVIVMPVAPFGGYWYGAGATSIATPRAFSVVHPRTMFDDVPQPRGGSAVKDVMTGVPGSTTCAVKKAHARPAQALRREADDVRADHACRPCSRTGSR